MTTAVRPRPMRRVALHATRVGLFVLVIALIHFKAQRKLAATSDQPAAPLIVDDVREFYEQAESISESKGSLGGNQVFDASGVPLGFVLQTSPQADHIVGFSGPTNTLIAFDTNSRILGIKVISSGDTKEHVATVRSDETFLTSRVGKTWDEAGTYVDAEGVTGATLTSLAIQEAIILRLGGTQPSLRFPEPLSVDDGRTLFATAHSVEQDPNLSALWNVFSNDHAALGTILRTSPAADTVVGYQGPTEALIGFDPGGRVVGVAVAKSYDNDEYVRYVRDDEYFLNLFNSLALEELAALDLEDEQVEGVSGATMTSMAVAEGLVLAAQQHRQTLENSSQPTNSRYPWSIRTLGTAVVVFVGVTIGLSRLRANRRIRLGFLCVLVLYLGLVNGDMLSQAMIVGWAQNGIPWRTGGGDPADARGVPDTSNDAQKHLLLAHLPTRCCAATLDASSFTECKSPEVAFSRAASCSGSLARLVCLDRHDRPSL